MNKSNVKGTSLKIGEIEEIINVYLGGLYNFKNMASMFYATENGIKSLLNNKELIEKYFGEQTYIDIREKANIIINLKDFSHGQELIRSHEIRKIIKPEIMYVDSNIKKSLNLAMLFIKYEGNLDIITEETYINKNEILTILNNKQIKELLLPEIIDHYTKILNIETNLFHRNCLMIDSTIKRIAYLKNVLFYKDKTISAILGLPLDQVNRLLLDSYTLIKYKKFNDIKKTEQEIKYETILNMYDLIVNNDLPLRKVGKIFDVSGVTVSNYMNKELKQISLEKYDKIQEKLNERNSHVTTILQLEKISEMKELYDNGYTIGQIGEQYGKDPSNIYRNLISFYPELANTMYTKRMKNLSIK